LRVTPPGVRIPLSPQKETHNESCGFFVFTNKPSLLELGSGNKKLTTSFDVVEVSMLAQDFMFGITASNPSFSAIKHNFKTA